MAEAIRSPMERWVAVLDAFVVRDQWGVRELAAEIGLSPTVTHRILHEMTGIGLLAPAATSGRFLLGPESARLAVLLAERLDVRRIARPILEATAAAIGETVILALYSPPRRQFWAVDAAESGHTIRYIWESLRPWSDLTRGSSGKGILAFLPEIEREAILASLDEPDRMRLRNELERFRTQGFAVSHGERFAGAIGVSAPIRDATSRVIGDLISGWPDNRTDPIKERLVATAIVAAASDLSRALGHRPDFAPIPDDNDMRRSDSRCRDRSSG